VFHRKCNANILFTAFRVTTKKQETELIRKRMIDSLFFHAFYLFFQSRLSIPFLFYFNIFILFFLPHLNIIRMKLFFNMDRELR
jgi:hypothetical protein